MISENSLRLCTSLRADKFQLSHSITSFYLEFPLSNILQYKTLKAMIFFFTNDHPVNLLSEFVCNCICISFFREPGWGGVCPRAEERDAVRVVDHQCHHAAAIGTAPNPTPPANNHLYVMRGHHRPQTQSCQRGILLSPEAGVTREQAGVQAEERNRYLETLLQDVSSRRPKGCLQVGELT